MRAVGVILAGGNNKLMRELSNKRAFAAMPIAGSYRSIDFALSNMSNSHIGKVAVITQYNARSLNEHLSSSKWWDFGRKQGGLFVFNTTITNEHSVWFCCFVVVSAAGDGVYKLDYNKVLEYHIEKKADITVVVKDIDSAEDARRFGVVRLAEDNRITDFEEKPDETDITPVSTGNYVIRRRLLIELLQKADEEDRYDFVKDILIRYKNIKRIYGYKLDTYWSNISTAEAYFKTNMDFLKKDVRDFFFKQYSDIYSKDDDLAPAKYNPGSSVKNSLIASGCIINGNVEDSVIFKKVYIGNNCTIKNCIVLNDVHIGDNSYFENCIIESRDTIKPNTTYVGKDGEIKIVIEKNERYSI